MTSFHDAVSDLGPEAAADLVAAALGRMLSERPSAILTREQAGTVDGRATLEVPGAQWTDAGGASRGVRIRVLGAAEIMDATAAAHRWAMRAMGPPPADPAWRWIYLTAYEAVQVQRQAVEELARMIIDPPGLGPDTVAQWNDRTIQSLYTWGVRLAESPPALIEAALARLHGGAIPPGPGASPDGGLVDPDGLGGPAGAAGGG